MPDTSYKRVDYDQLLYFTQYMLNKIKNSPLANVIETVQVNGTALTPAGKTVNVLVPIEVIQVNGTAQTITDKTVNLTVPTNNNQLTNGAGYQTASDVSTAITTALANFTTISFTKVNSVSALPATGAAGTIYLVPNSGSSGNIYNEYFWDSVSNAYEMFGTTEVDLSGYVQASQMATLTNAEIETAVTTAYNTVFSGS